jgi:3-phosphoshikimate 1-carboxyvinyltransferase
MDGAGAERAVPPPRAIRTRGPLDGRIRVPGSRSIANRALVCAALAPGASRLLGVTESDDTAAMRDGLRGLGAVVEAEAGEIWRVEGCAGRFPARGARVDVRASGTTARFLTAAATLAAGPTTLDGTARMRARPIADLADALRALGAEVEVLGRDGCPPVRVAGGGLPGGRARIDARRSSQYVSGVLLAAPCAARDVELEFAEGAVVSRAFLELTGEVMRAFGADVEIAAQGARVRARPYQAREYRVEGDAQSAVYPLAAAAIAGGRVLVEGIPPGSRQTDLRVLAVFERMGCRVARTREGIELYGPFDGLRAVDVDMNEIPDAVLALAVVCLFADGPSTIRNIAHLRIKESDRLAALESELRKLGARAQAGADSLRIEPGPLRGARIATYDDHRMAMSFALAGLRVPGVEIEDPACVAKTWPGFFDALEGL